MNDALNAQLASSWTIPPYARDLLWVESESGVAQAEGAKGLFTLPAPAEVLTIRWGSADGSPLVQLRWQPDSLNWDGAVRIGGFIDAMHVAELPDLDTPLFILTIGGQPLRPNITPFPDTAQRQLPIAAPDFSAAVAEEVDEAFTIWAALDESPTLAFAQDALVSKMRVHCYGHLTDQKWGWHEFLALPIALEGMTLFGS
jgi:hypothetical protein